MTETTLLFAAAGAGIVGLAIASTALLRGWNAWLELRRLELQALRGHGGLTARTNGRVELADLQERVRKLEAIASGVDL